MVTVRGLRRARCAMLHPSQCPAPSGGWCRKQPWPGHSGLSGEGQGQPSVHSEWVSRQVGSSISSQIPGPWPPAPGGDGVVMSIVLWLRLGVQTTVEGPAGQGWHLIFCPLDAILFFQTPPSWPPAPIHQTHKRGRSPALMNCPKSEDTHPGHNS